MAEAPVPESRPKGYVLATDAAHAAPRHDAYAAWRVRAFALFTGGALFSGIGAQMQSVAIGWELYERTHRAMALGWVGIAQGLPILLFALVGGQVADRFDRRRVVMLAQLLQVFCSLTLATISSLRGPVETVYGVLFLSGVARAFAWPAGASLLPLLVPKTIFSNAVTWRSTTFQIASVAGPALGGAVIAIHHSATAVYLIHASLTLVYFGFLMAMTPPRQEKTAEAFSARSLLAGFQYVWKNQIVLAAIALDLFAVLLGGAVALLPIYAKDILRVGPTGLGWLQAAPAAGAFLMATALAHLPPFRRAGRTLLWVVAGFGAVTVVFGVSKWFWLSLLMLAASGALDNISVVIRHSLIQLRTPDGLRGRVSAVNSIFISSSNELGGFRAGAMAQWLGAVPSVVIGGIGTLGVVAAAVKLWPQMLCLGRVDEEQKAAGAAH